MKQINRRTFSDFRETMQSQETQNPLLSSNTKPSTNFKTTQNFTQEEVEETI